MTIANEITDLQNNLASAKAAVTTKGGTVGNTGLAGLASEIATIPSGGGDVVEKDVNFYDYDGTLVAGYTLAEAHSLSALPTAPTHPNLEFVDWTETLSFVQNVSGKIDIGAMYQDAQSHGLDTVLHVYVGDGDNITLHIKYTMGENSTGMTIDWGDSTTADVITVSGNTDVSHTYSGISLANAPFTIRITLGDGDSIDLGYSTKTFITYNPSGSTSDSSSRLVFDLVIGKASFNSSPSASSGTGPFNNMTGLTTVVLSPEIQSIAISRHRVFYGCSGLKFIVFPVITTSRSIGAHYMENCRSLIGFTVPSSNYTGNSSYEFLTHCECLKKLNLSKTNFNVNQASYLTNLTSMEVTPSQTGLTFANNWFIPSIRVPSAMTSINFNYCGSLKTVIFEKRASMPGNFLGTSNWVNVVDLSEFDAVPTVSSGFFTNMLKATIIKVPASLENAWKAASVWSDYASQIVGV